MGERLTSVDSAAAEPGLERLGEIHLDTLRFFILPPCAIKHRLSQDCLKGPCLDIGSTDNAGAKALKDLGVRVITEICFPATPNASLQETRRRQERLIERLRLIPDQSIRLVTIFDHGKNGRGLVATNALREIERTLIPGGQYLISCRNIAQAPRHDVYPPKPDEEADNLGRKLSMLGFLSKLPLLPVYWYKMDDEYYPNKYVSIHTKPSF